MEETDKAQQAFENRLFGLEEKIEGESFVSIFDAKRLNMGGFITTSFTSIFNDNEDWSAFDHTHMELIIAPRITEKLSAFFAVGLMTRADWDNSLVEANSSTGMAMPPQSLTSKRKFDNLEFYTIMPWLLDGENGKLLTGGKQDSDVM